MAGTRPPPVRPPQARAVPAAVPSEPAPSPGLASSGLGGRLKARPPPQGGGGTPRLRDRRVCTPWPSWTVYVE